MNSMLATLNMRKRTREKLDTNDKGWNSIPLGTVPTINGPKKIQGHSSIAAVDFETNSVGFCLIMASRSESFKDGHAGQDGGFPRGERSVRRRLAK